MQTINRVSKNYTLMGVHYRYKFYSVRLMQSKYFVCKFLLRLATWGNWAVILQCDYRDSGNSDSKS